MRYEESPLRFHARNALNPIKYHVINTSCHEYSLSMTTSSGISWRHRFEQIDIVIVNISGDPKSSHVPATTVRIIQGIHDATVWLPVSWACLVEAQAWKQDSKHSKRDATNHLEVSDCDIFVDFLHVCLTGHYMASRHLETFETFHRGLSANIRPSRPLAISPRQETSVAMRQVWANLVEIWVV